ncbi:MAG: type I restriction enzyme HsdR N-terminal domain-containing protein [Dehalococcoidia bacterium]
MTRIINDGSTGTVASSLAAILAASSSGYALDIFTSEEIASVELIHRSGKPYLKCQVTGKERPAKPEEIVRQLYLRKLIQEYGYPIDRIAIEKGVYFGSSMHEKRADIVVFEKDTPDTPYIIVECKKPKRKDGLEQLKSYCNAEGSPIGVWTNGGEALYLHREEPNLFKNLPDIPRADQKLSDLLSERWDIKRLTEENRLVHERLSLRDIILDMEDLVLANAGVDAFEEVFKLIYAKLYDEWNASRPSKKTKHLEFRIYGSTARELYERINGLFDRAKSQWPGVFLADENIELEPNHLITCVSFLEDIKLFNSNLQIIDEAFEYLAVQVGKGAKGQYFTPRHVIDMCVKMLNPNIDETMIDTAAGSCGFTVHTIFHVWGNVFTAEGPEKWQSDYASEKVFGIDFDSRSVKIAKALNLIAGDGRTNVYRANTLDPHHWPDDIKVALKPFLRRFPDSRADDQENQKSFRHFSFDLLMTNPPFAGDIKDSRILHQYELAKKWLGIKIDPEKEPEKVKRYAGSGMAEVLRDSGKWQDKQGRDILFIERNLDFLKPGGRMCIVLPQGRYNNTTDEYIRRFIAEKARILAVVGLQGNTFKPHTGTKTSVLFLQKWNDDFAIGPLCPRVDDYPIFFATSQNGGKDNSGDYVYKKDKDGRPLLDDHGHMIVEHDLDQIAEGFIQFAKKEGFSFWKEE